MPFSPISEILDELRAGRMVILVDDPDRENEGDLVMAAEKVTPEAINFMIRHGSGIVCLTLPQEKADALHLPLQVASNSSRFGTQFTVTIEARQGVTTGRLRGRPRDDHPHRRPGRLPARGPRPARPRLPDPRGARAGCCAAPVRPRAAATCCRLAGLKPYGVICEVMNADGTMSRTRELELLQAETGLKMCSVRDIIEWRRRRERLDPPRGDGADADALRHVRPARVHEQDRPRAAPRAQHGPRDAARPTRAPRRSRSPSSCARTASA